MNEKGKPAKELLNYCSNPIPNHFLVLVNDNYMDKSSFTRSLTKIMDPINVSTPFATDLYKWARFFFKENGKNIFWFLFIASVTTNNVIQTTPCLC